MPAINETAAAHRPPAILLIGPTASGKSGAALAIAEVLPVEVIAVDSATVFRDMDIGTAKPDAATRARTPHHLVDIVSPEEHYSAGRFRSDALAAMAEIRARGKVPLLVGGTMLYVKALTEGLSKLPTGDAALRAAIDAEAAERGWPALHAELAEIDPVAAEKIAPTNPQRIQRALEVYRASGRPISSFWTEGRPGAAAADFLTIALVPGDRAVLHQRIAQRFRQMLADGLVDEVQSLKRKYRLDASLPSMRCVGYRQVWDMLDGAMPAAELEDRGIFATRQLAKRQLTWLRSMDGLHEIDCLAANAKTRALAAVQTFLGRHAAA
ncbi:MAG TPA: tRNA (adenosine(37)-N6)-dimethylallyltransferase MiaA [Rhodocyclaceae bacterium]